MTADNYRHCMEVAVALLRQGHDAAALDVLSNALNGVCPPATPGAEPVSLELAFEDETPEIPGVFVTNEGASMEISDKGWTVAQEVVDECTRVATGLCQLHRSVYAIEEAMREVLRLGVKAGTVRKEPT